MFDIGDKVVYPMHGAGIIEGIEEREILGQVKKYYVMRMPIGEMKVMIPLENVEEIGIREIVDDVAVDRVLSVLGESETDSSTNWNQRYRNNMNKMKSGDIYEVAYVVRSLMVREIAKGLSSGERKMLDQAKQILVSELSLANNIGSDEAIAMLEDVVINQRNTSL